jgi:hypothetical protein
LKLVAYAEIDGIRTAPDSQLRNLWEQTEKEDLVSTVFYEGTIRTAEAFLAMAKSPGTAFYFIMVDDEVAGYTWLNRFENKTARQHFCVFRKYWGSLVDIGKSILNQFLHMKDGKGQFVVDLLTGFVPAWNERAIKFSLKCGGKTYGLIPNAIYNAKTGQSEAAVFIYYTRRGK